MEACHVEAAEYARRWIEAGHHDRVAFRDALLTVPPPARDAWVDLVLGLAAPAEDGPELPRGCVPYLPCSVGALLEIAEHVSIGPSDVFVDIGSGAGRAGALVHLLTGASVIGLEIQPQLVDSARRLAARLLSDRIAVIEGDAARLAGSVATGTVFFLYCPFSGARLFSVLADLEAIAATKPIHVCCVDLPLPACAWLARKASATSAHAVEIYRSTRSPAA